MKEIPSHCLVGIAVTTYNRRSMVVDLVKKLRELTISDYFLVICDDGSADGTQAALAELGVCCIGKKNKGIAWNKNRGLFFFTNVCRADYIILMDDDVAPLYMGWELEWINGARKVGHVNYVPASYPRESIRTPMTSHHLGFGHMVGGMLFAQSAKALASTGYMDTRFGRYGHEHSEFSLRFIRAGFGGLRIKTDGTVMTVFYLMNIGVELLPATTHGTPEELEKNGKLLGEVSGEAVYRSPWSNDEERMAFLSEFSGGFSHMEAPPIKETWFDVDSYAQKNEDVVEAGWSPFVHYFMHGHKENRET